MRSLILTRPSPTSPPTLAFTDSQPTPSAPPPGHVLIQIHASAIQPSDIYNAHGGFGSTTFPRVPGRDFSGVVVAPASHPLHGTAVFGSSGSTHAFTVDGFQAEYAVIPEGGVAPKPASMSHAQAAIVGVPFTTAALTVKRAAARKGETALVLGANGAVGRTATLVLESQGVRVLKGVRGAKNEDEVDTSADPELKKAKELTAGKGVDVVIDTVGMPALTRAAVENALGSGGRLVFIAAPKTGTAELTFDMKGFYRQQKSLLGVNSVAFSVEEMATSLKELMPMFESGEWEKAMAGKWTEVSLEEAVAAYGSQEKGKKFVVKVV